ncbi:MAG: hypothetical protein QOI31_1652 [Solirubrobacterales bacterium]|jgi:hypothetical protein|nr:hypothetical protein [Solirubrobacterales bacterium]
MIAAGCIWAAVAWASTTVQVDGLKGTTSKDLTYENSDIKGIRYTMPDGAKQNVTGWSLQKVLDSVKIREDAWTRIFIGGIEIRRDEYELFSSKREPVFAFDNSQQNVYFIRPKKGDSPAETDRSNNLRMNYRVPIDVSPPVDKPETGETIKFRADAPGPDSQYQFEWNASSGETGTGSTFEYTFPYSPGRVQINVEGTKSGQVQAEQTIGTPVKAPPPENNPTPDYTPPSSSYTPGYTPPSDYDYNFPDGSVSEIPETKTPKTPDPDETPPLEIPGTSVEGELLSATAPLPPSSGDALPPDEQLPPDPEQAIEEAEEISGPGALIAGGIVVGLLGLGAGREMETVRPRRLWRPDLSGLRRLLPPWK